jgi:hypothetical protein
VTTISDHPIVIGPNGTRGRVETESDAQGEGVHRVLVRFEDGQGLWIQPEALVLQPDGSYELQPERAEAAGEHSPERESATAGRAESGHNTGQTAEYFRPAYEFGRSLRHSGRFGNKSWAELEAAARELWEDHNPGTWAEVAQAVVKGWQQADQGADNI